MSPEKFSIVNRYSISVLKQIPHEVEIKSSLLYYFAKIMPTV